MNHFFTNLYKIFTNLMIRQKKPLYDKHSVTVRAEAIFLLESLFVRLHNLLISAESCY